jgi:hypothetical protein
MVCSRVEKSQRLIVFLSGKGAPAVVSLVVILCINVKKVFECIVEGRGDNNNKTTYEEMMKRL